MGIEEMIARLQEIAVRHSDVKLTEDQRYDFESLLEELNTPSFYVTVE